jgi:hypothetical protein
MGAVQLKNLLLLSMSGLFHDRPKVPRRPTVGTMMVKNMTNINPHFIEGEDEEQGSGLEIAELQNERFLDEPEEVDAISFCWMGERHEDN